MKQATFEVSRPDHQILRFTEVPLLNCLAADGAPADAPVKPSWKFCPFCGGSLSGDKVNE